MKKFTMAGALVLLLFITGCKGRNEMGDSLSNPSQPSGYGRPDNFMADSMEVEDTLNMGNRIREK